ncbi:MAG TPA: carboxypeptidase-like regulatory domain-containing protein [Anaeromyxobacteraceae bacterium]|nr:carboxypeptidase-like regulatory domain-containing protein [Anaeromyxobacteraceae bacterium]
MNPHRRLAAAALAAWPLVAGAAPADALAQAALGRVSPPPVPGVPGELRGKVTLPDGSPVKRFTVNGNQFDDRTGAFKILVPPEGDFRVVFRAVGFAPNVVHVQGAAGKKLVFPEIALGQGEDFFGEVLDAQTERPVVGARVALADPAKVERLRLVRPEALTASATTGSGGMFMIRRAPRALLMLVVHQRGYLTEFVPVNTREGTVTVKLHRGGAITGRVLGSGGKPLIGARVAAISEGAFDGDEVWTDAHGDYQFEGLRPGAYTVMANASGGKASVAPAPVRVTDGRVVFVPFDVKGRGKTMDLEELRLGDSKAPATGRGKTMDLEELHVGATGPPARPVAAR